MGARGKKNKREAPAVETVRLSNADLIAREKEQKAKKAKKGKKNEYQ